LNAKGIDCSGMTDQTLQHIADGASQRLNKESGGGYQTVGSPIIGTCTDCLEYFNTLGLSQNYFSSYLNKVAPFAERIEVNGPGQKAGFIPWTGSTSSKLSDADVKTYGVAMLVIKAKDDAIHTYWASNGSPGDTEPAPPSKIGTMNMVKTYYTEVYKNNTIVSKTADGTFCEPNCVPSISIDEENAEYKLEKWSINGTYNPSITYANFPSGTRMGTTPQVVNLKTPEKTVYVLLKRVITEEIEDKDYNYLLKQ